MKNGKDIELQTTTTKKTEINNKSADLILSQEALDNRGIVDALNRSYAVISFDMEGRILEANDNFLSVFNYERDEIIGKHHRVLVDKEESSSSRYDAFWANLNKGNFSTGVVKRIGKHGNEIWLQCTYNPILDKTGKPVKVIKFASDITNEMHKNVDLNGQIEAIRKSQAVITFSMDGRIEEANDLFLEATGYRLEEIKGKHHSMFLNPEEVNSAEYKQLWSDLNSGKFIKGKFKRLNKAGEVIWLQATYNPILDLNGKPSKVVKFANNITEEVHQAEEIRRIHEQEALRALEENASKQIQNQVIILSEVLERAANGDLTAEVPIKGDDAMGKIGLAIEDLLHNMCANLSTMSHNSQLLAAASEELNVVGNQMSDNAAQTHSKSIVVSDVANQVSANLEEVVVNCEQLHESIRDISKNAAEAASVANQAVTAADKANGTIMKLGDSSVEIGNIVKVITSIAQQTNLLALNATIEAARAGEAGRGFAVVANEVKELAKETARATEDISRKVEIIQQDTSSATMAIGEISSIIRLINDTQNMIASAVEEQSATTSSISSTVSVASKGGADIVSNMAQVTEAAQFTASGAGDSQKAAEELSKMANEMEKLVAQFKFN